VKTLAACSTAVAAAWAALYLTPAPVPPKTAWYDTSIVYEIAIVFSTAALVMLISRKMWTIRAIGLFFSALAIGLLFWNAVYVRQSGYRVEGGRVVANTDHGIQEAVSDLARALLIVGGPLLMVGLVIWLYGRFGPDHDPVVDHDRDRRRPGVPGRRREDWDRADLADSMRDRGES
jgi:hypothetical protein